MLLQNRNYKRFKNYIKTEATIIFITHDITEALKLGTKVLVLDKGEIQQYDTPKNICSNPKNEFIEAITKNGRDVKGVNNMMKAVVICEAGEPTRR